MRLALLEADVNYKVAKSFIERVKERAVGEEVMRSLTPAQQVVKIVHEELTGLLGESARGGPERPASRRPDAGGSARIGQDHHRGQAGPAPQEPGPPGLSGARRRAAPGGHRAAPASGGGLRGGGISHRTRPEPGGHRRGRHGGGLRRRATTR